MLDRDAVQLLGATGSSLARRSGGRLVPSVSLQEKVMKSHVMGRSMTV
jgi:hypothetical protein